MTEQRNLSYKVDKNNQLYIKSPQDSRYVPLKGRFKVDDNNNLVYQVEEPPVWRRKYGVGNKIVLEGSWKLDSNHDLIFVLREEEKLKRKSLKLRGKILDAGNDFLIFEITSKPAENVTTISALKLRGIWKADKFNRLTFEVRRNQSPDTLIFRSTWELNESKQIIYNYEKLVTKEAHSLTFKGYWQISDKKRLSYILEGGKGGCLNFNVNLETPNLYPKKGAIKYRIGIGLKKVRKERLITFEGSWKFGRKQGLIFESDLGSGGMRRIYFSYSLKLTPDDRFILTLFNNERQSLGISLTLKRGDLESRDFEYFLRLRKESRGHVFELGAKVRF